MSDDGPFDVWWMSKNGLALRIAAGLKLKNGEVKEIKVDDHLGIVNVRGDNQARALMAACVKAAETLNLGAL